MTVLVFALLGGVAGLVLLSGSGGFFAGAALGALAAGLSALSKRVQTLERALDARSGPTTAAPHAAQRAAPISAAAAAAPTVAAAAASSSSRARSLPPVPLPRTEAALDGPEQSGLARPQRPRAPAGAKLEPPLFAVGRDRVIRWFTTGNVPVKVGVVLSVFGVGFLVKEGIDREWLVLPIEIRLLLVALFGIALLGLGWRLRDRQRSYALSVQGGGIAVLYLVTYASFAL
jgi:uncharacterized membrane protein